MSKSGITRTLSKRVREFAGWFQLPPLTSRRFTIVLTAEELRSLREHLDRAALALEMYADRLARDEGADLAQVEGEQWRITERKRKRASELADALLEDRKYEIR